MSEKVTLPKSELFAMLDIIAETTNFCAVWMPVERYHASAMAVWVLAHRAAGDDAKADELKSELMQRREVWLASEREKINVI